MKAQANVVRLDLAAIVDQLGAIKAQQADLKARAGTLQAQLIEAGVTEADGALFRATVSYSNVESVDWKAIAAKLEPSYQLVAAHTSYAPRTTVKVVARKTS
jgi:hypothetical protein